jgi:hypothetical protein
MSRLRLIAVCLLIGLTQVAMGFEAKVLSTVGGVHFQRGEQTQMARERARLITGDMVRTTHNSGASLLLGNCIVYVGPQTSTQIGTDDGIPTLFVFSGQVRAVATGMPGMQVLTDSSVTSTSEGILRVTVDHQSSRIASLEGQAYVNRRIHGYRQQVELTNFAPDESTVLQPGQQLAIPSNGAPTASTGIEGTDAIDEESEIEVDSLQEQAAAAAERQRRERQTAQNPPTNTRGANTQANRNTSNSQNNVVAAPGFGFGFGSFASAASFSASGGSNADNLQRTITGTLTTLENGVDDPSLTSGSLGSGDVFSGSVHLVTAENQTFNNVGLDNSLPTPDLPEPQYWSIAPFTSSDHNDYTIQIASNDGFSTVQINAIAGSVIPLSDGRAIVRYDATALMNADPITGNGNVSPLNPDAGTNGAFVGTSPEDNFSMSLATIPTDTSDFDVLNDKLTYTLGQVVLRDDNGQLVVGIRRSDQDRLIDYQNNVRDDGDDLVSANRDVTYRVATLDDQNNPANNGEIVDGRDYIPTDLNRSVNLTSLGANGQEAMTRIMASGLRGFAERTGQTRFVVDGKIIDIAGAP